MNSTIKEPVVVSSNESSVKVLQRMNEKHFTKYGIYSQTLLRSLGKKIENSKKTA
jgi:hypothetical protein